MKVYPRLCIICLFCCVLLLPQAVSSQDVVQESRKFGGVLRTFYTFVPQKTDSDELRPLIVLLHGSNGSAQRIVNKWKGLAMQEGVFLVGPSSRTGSDWRIPEDGPDFIYELVELLKSRYKIDPRRVYLFGHSGGAIQALHLSIYESQYFAGAVAHAGVIDPLMVPLIAKAKRKIPISIIVGTIDQFFPLKDVRDTRDALNSKGFNSKLTEIKGHTHDYLSNSEEINQLAWQFLKDQKLDSDPVYERYKWPKPVASESPFEY